MVHFRQYLTLDWRDFPENSNLRHIIAVSQNSKGTVLEEYSTFLAVSQFTFEEYSWKKTYGTLNVYTTNDVTLVAIGR